jgi:hypothetical protein
VARPTKLTRDRHERMVQMLRAGNYRDAAARAAGIAPSTLYSWLERGSNEQLGPYHEFAAAVQQAEAEAEVYAVAIIRRAMSDDWRAAATYLERRHPERWRRRSTTELTGKDGGPITTESEHRLDLSTLTDDELRILERLNAHTHPAGN